MTQPSERAFGCPEIVLGSHQRGRAEEILGVYLCYWLSVLRHFCVMCHLGFFVVLGVLLGR